MAISYMDKCSLQIIDVTLVDNTNGIVPMIGYPDIRMHQYEDKFLEISDSLFVGQSPWTDCEADRIVENSVTFMETGNLNWLYQINILKYLQCHDSNILLHLSIL